MSPDIYVAEQSERLEAIRLLKECRLKNGHLIKALEINQLISKEFHLGSLLKQLMQITQESMESEACSLFLIEEKTGDLLFQVALGESGASLKEIHRVKKGCGIAGWVAEHGVAVLQNDVYQDARFNPEYDHKTGFKTRSILCVPLIYADRCIGVVQVINRIVGDYEHSNIHACELLAQIAAVAIENARAHQQIMDKLLLDYDMKLANNLQQSFLPQQSPDLKGYNCSFFNRSAYAVGGDLYDLYEMQDGRWAMMVGDVSGKGVSAALMMSRVMKDAQSACMRGTDAGEIMERINMLTCENSFGGMFVTLVLFLLDPESGQIEMANAGHLPPVLLKQGQAQLLETVAAGPPAGILSAVNYQTTVFHLERDSSLVFYTDGLTEARDNDDALLGQDGMMVWMDKAPIASELCLEYLKRKLERYVNGASQSDDITMFVLHRKP